MPPEMEPKRAQIQAKSRPFLAPFFLPGTRWPANGPRGSFRLHFPSKFHDFSMKFGGVSTDFIYDFPTFLVDPAYCLGGA